MPVLREISEKLNFFYHFLQILLAFRFDVWLTLPAHSIRRCSSGVEQRIRNAWVVSSNLTSGCLFSVGVGVGAHRHSASLAQLVEQLTLNQFVRGSSPRGGISL